MSTLLDRTGAPPCTWLLAMIYVCFVLNHTYNATIKNIPMNVATCSTCDISPLLSFHFWQPVYFKLDDSNFPGDFTEETDRFVDVSENVGNDMTFSILNTTTHKVINRSNVRPAGEPASPNLRIDPLTAPEIVNLGTFLQISSIAKKFPLLLNQIHQMILLLRLIILCLS